MEDLQSPMSAETEALRALYAALNRNDISGVVASFAPDIEWIEPDHFATGGPHLGLDTVREHFAKARDTWAEGTCEPVRFIVAGDRIIVFCNVYVRLKGHTEWAQGPTADVYTFRNGKVVQARVFDNRQEALDWVGVAE